MNVLRSSANAAVCRCGLKFGPSGVALRRTVVNVNAKSSKRFCSNTSKNGGKTTYRVVEPESGTYTHSHTRTHTGTGTGYSGAYTTNGQRVIFNQRNYQRKSVGYSIAGLFSLGCNIVYACTRAQDKPETHTLRMFTFLFGLPGTIVSFFLVREGSEIAYGIDLPTRQSAAAAVAPTLQRTAEAPERTVVRRSISPNDRAVS